MILLRIFKNSRPGGMAGLFLLLLGIFLFSFIRDFSSEGISSVTQHQGMPFYKLILGAIHTVPLLNHVIAMLLMMLISYMLIRIGVRDQLLDQRSLMPAIFFIIFTAALPEARQMSPALVGSVLYLMCFAILFEVHDKEPDTFSVFIASVFLVLGSMFYLKLIWFIPLMWASLRTMRPVTWREMFYPVVAYMILALFFFTWYWGVMGDGELFRRVVAENMAFSGGFKAYHFSVYILYGYLLLLVLVASVYMVNHFQTRKSVLQSIYQVMFYMFVLGLLFLVFVARFDPSSLVFVAFPVSFVLSNYFHRKRNPWTHEVALWILLGMVVYVQVMA
jgi:hypothetical protein